MIKTIIFSKDRPLQLDLTLQSLLKNFPSSTENVVIYKNSDKNFDYAYSILKENYIHNVKFIKETQLFKQIIKEVHTSLKYVNFLTDDCIVYGPVNITEDFGPLMNSEDYSICCFSLRLGENIIYRSHEGTLYNENVPQMASYGKYLIFNRLSIPPGGYFAYPLSVDGHIFKRDLIKSLCIDALAYIEHVGEEMDQTPNNFEHILQKFFFDIPPLMACGEVSCVVNSPNNRVQNSYKNFFGQTYNYHQVDLLSKFMSNFRINMDSLDFSNIQCPHQEIELFK